MFICPAPWLEPEDATPESRSPQVWDREKVILMPDHYIFTDDPRANRNVDQLREYAHKYDIKYFYDIKDRSDFQANPDYRGVCHIALAEAGHTIPGEIMFGTDSHTCNAGAFGMFATGIGNTDAGFVLGTGKLLVKVPPTLLFRLEGEMPPYLQAKDIILHIIGEIGVRWNLFFLQCCRCFCNKCCRVLRSS